MKRFTLLWFVFSVGLGGCSSDATPETAPSGGSAGAVASASGRGGSGESVSGGPARTDGGSSTGGEFAGAMAGGADVAGSPSASGGRAGGGGGPTTGGLGGAAGTGGAAARGGGNTTGGAGSPPVGQDDLPTTTLYLAGDSTVSNYEATSAQEGWGQELGQFFIGKLKVDNRAVGGTSSRTFQSFFADIVTSLKPGDFVIADFGINDSGGDATRSTTPAEFKKYMSQMNAQTVAKKAGFIIVTPSALQYWVNGKETNARLEPYVAVDMELGMSDHIPIADLNARSLEYLNMIGQTAAMKIYIGGDKAHFTKTGATQMASFVAAELKRIAHPLAKYLK